MEKLFEGRGRCGFNSEFEKGGVQIKEIGDLGRLGGDEF